MYIFTKCTNITENYKLKSIPKNTEAILFTRCRPQITNNNNVEINNTQLQRKHQVTYPGSYRLAFNNHK